MLEEWRCSWNIVVTEGEAKEDLISITSHSTPMLTFLHEFFYINLHGFAWIYMILDLHVQGLSIYIYAQSVNEL